MAESDKDTSSYCQLCGKHFSTQNAYDNHLQSKKHKETYAKHEAKLEKEAQKQKQKNQEKDNVVVQNNDKVLMKNARNQALKDSIQAGDAPQSVAMETEGPAAGRSKPKAKADKNAAPQMEVDDEGTLKNIP